MSFAYYRFFPGDYLRDTLHLGWLEDCAYRRLIDLYYMRGRPIPNDRSYIMRAIRANEPEQQAAADYVLTEFFLLKPDGWHQKKCDAELDWQRCRSAQGKRAVAARETRKINNQQLSNIIGSSSDDHRIIQPEPEPEPYKNTPIVPSGDDGFASFWKAYPKKVGKGAAEKAWKRANLNGSLTVVLDALEAQKASEQWRKEGGRYVPNPATWINQRRWEDEPQVVLEDDWRKEVVWSRQ